MAIILPPLALTHAYKVVAGDAAESTATSLPIVQTRS